MAEGSEEEGPSPVHFLKKPLFYWAKSFTENEVRREDSFTKFLSSDALNYALDYIGIPRTSDCEQSSLHLSSIFDEDGNQSFSNGTQSTSLTSNSSRSKYSTTNQLELELKQRIQNLNRVFNELKCYYEEHFSQIVILKPPNSVHISNACGQCGIQEYEKILLLLLGAAIQGTQKSETIRKIRGFPTNIQEQLIESIKQATVSPDLVHVKPWTEVSSLSNEEQQKVYDSLITHLRRLVYERNDAVQSHLLAEYSCGLTNCEQRRGIGTKGYDSLDLEKYSDDNRFSSAMRQLREELLEKSDLLKDCREELEMTKSKLHSLRHELNETQQQLRSCKKARDEFDVLREGQEKSLRLEAELQKMKKKLEEFEQYYERVEILENENRTYQRKHALLMDQINMLTVDKERLEVSFMTQQSHLMSRSPRPYSPNSDSEIRSPFLFTPRKVENYTEELLLDSSDNEGKDKQVDENEKNLSETRENGSDETKPKTMSLGGSDLPAFELNNLAVNTLEDEKPEERPLTPEPKSLSRNSSKCKDAETQDMSFGESDETSLPKSQKEKRHGNPKRGHRRGGALSGKRTKKSTIYPQAKVILRKVQNLSSSMEKLDEVALRHYQQISADDTNSIDSTGKKNFRRKYRRGRSDHEHTDNSSNITEFNRNATPTPTHRRITPNVDDRNESDADGERSLSPDPNFHRSSSPRSPEPQIRFSTNHNFQRSSYLDNLHPHQATGSDLDCEDELYFVCSTTAVPTNHRNVRIYAPIGTDTTKEDPIRQSDFIYNRQSMDPQRHEEFLSSPIGRSRRDRHVESPEMSQSPQSLGTRCSIQVSLRHVNANSHQFSLLEPGNESYDQNVNNYRPKPPPTAVGKGMGSYPTTFTLNQIDPVSSSEEDDDSVWYEYGCV